MSDLKLVSYLQEGLQSNVRLEGWTHSNT